MRSCEMLIEEGLDLIERDKIHAVVKIDVTSPPNPDKFLPDYPDISSGTKSL